MGQEKDLKQALYQKKLYGWSRSEQFILSAFYKSTHILLGENIM